MIHEMIEKHILPILFKREDLPLTVFGGFIRSFVRDEPHSSDLDIASSDENAEDFLLSSLQEEGIDFEVEDRAVDGYSETPTPQLVRVHLSDDFHIDLCRHPLMRPDFLENFLTITERNTVVRGWGKVNGITIPAAALLTENLRNKTLTPFPFAPQARVERFRVDGWGILPPVRGAQTPASLMKFKRKLRGRVEQLEREEVVIGREQQEYPTRRGFERVGEIPGPRPTPPPRNPFHRQVERLTLEADRAAAQQLQMLAQMERANAVVPPAAQPVRPTNPWVLTDNFTYTTDTTARVTTPRWRTTLNDLNTTNGVRRG